MHTNISAAAALDKLKVGNEKFVNDKLSHEGQDTNRRVALVDGQDPFVIILSCADSRVVPELAFDAGLGELFTIRVAGNVANISTIASIEYAVAHLGVNLIVVLGHQNCGAVTAALSMDDNGYNLNHLLAHILPACKQSESREVNTVVQKNARLTSLELEKRSSIIKKQVEAEQLKILPAYYNLDTGKVDFLD